MIEELLESIERLGSELDRLKNLQAMWNSNEKRLEELTRLQKLEQKNKNL